MAAPFRVAEMYPNLPEGEINRSCGLEAACITKAVIKEAQKEGLDVSLDSYVIDRSAFSAVNMANKIAEKKYDGVVGTMVSADAIPVSDIFERNKTPFITPTATHPAVTANKKYALRVPFNDYRQAKLLARLAVNEFKPKRLAVISNLSNPYSIFLGAQFPKEVQALNGSILIHDFKVIDGFNEFKELAGQIMQTQPDIVFVPLHQDSIASLYAELVTYDQPLLLLGSDTIGGEPEFRELFSSKPSKIRFIFPKHWNGSIKGKINQRYLRILKSYCPQYPPSMSSAAAYDAIELLLSGMRTRSKVRGIELINAIKQAHFEGVTGPIVYGQDGDPKKPIELFELKGNKLFYWKRYE